MFFSPLSARRLTCPAATALGPASARFPPLRLPAAAPPLSIEPRAASLEARALQRRQERFRATIHAMPHVIASCALMTQAGGVLGVPLVTTEQYPKALGNTVREIDTGRGLVFAKTRFSMLTPEVEAHLGSLGSERRQAVVFGIEAHVCVYQSCMDLLERGWDVHIVADAVSSSRALYRDVALQRLRQSGCYVTSAEGVLFDLMRDTTFPGFKQVSGLVKEHNAALAALQSHVPPALLL